ncbi:MAG: pitrilysin family protein [Yoonia sp.]|nr:pitrilysin family protein [Yoonia sp.]
MLRILLTACFVLAASIASATEIKEVTSEGGINAWVVEEPSIPFTALEIRMRGGASLDLPDKRGAVNLMMALIEEGSGDMDARAFQTKLDALAASFSFRAYDDTMSISARFLTENKDEVLALLHQALSAPRFDQDAIDRVRAQVLSGIASDAKSPNRIASTYFDNAAFGNHPYGSSIDGTVESVNALTQADMFEAYRNTLTRAEIYVSAVGDITADEIGPMLGTLLGDLPAEGPPAPPHVDFGLKGGLTVIPYETPQSVALFGHRGITRDDDDFFAAYILNEILGGSGFESRLMNEVREKRGLTYGIRSYLVPKFHAEMWIGQVASGNAAIAEAIQVTRDVWTDLATNGATPEELATMKTYLTGEYPLRFDGNAEIADIMVGMQMIGLPTEYVINRNAYIEAVTLEDLNRVAKELLHPDELHFVVVGQPVGLESTD